MSHDPSLFRAYRPLLAPSVIRACDHVGRRGEPVCRIRCPAAEIRPHPRRASEMRVGDPPPRRSALALDPLQMDVMVCAGRPIGQRQVPPGRTRGRDAPPIRVRLERSDLVLQRVVGEVVDKAGVHLWWAWAGVQTHGPRSGNQNC